MKRYLQCILFGLISLTGLGQNPNSLITKPTIMAFPFAKEGEDVRTILESDFNRRIILTKVKEAFDNRGYSTIDFISKARNLQVDMALNDAQTDVKTQIIQASGADIAVEVEYEYNKTSSGNQVKVLLTAYEGSTGASLSNKMGESPLFRSDDVGALAARAVASVMEDFLNVMQEKFNDIVVNGKYIAIEFGLTDDSEIRMSSEVGEDALPLSDAIELWIGDNSKSYHIAGITEKRLILDVVRIPREVTQTKYSLDIYRFCTKLYSGDNPGAKFKIERIVRGNKLYINFK